MKGRFDFYLLYFFLYGIFVLCGGCSIEFLFIYFISKRTSFISLLVLSLSPSFFLVQWHHGRVASMIYILSSSPYSTSLCFFIQFYGSSVSLYLFVYYYFNTYFMFNSPKILLYGITFRFYFATHKTTMILFAFSHEFIFNDFNPYSFHILTSALVCYCSCCAIATAAAFKLYFSFNPSLSISYHRPLLKSVSDDGESWVLSEICMTEI